VVGRRSLISHAFEPLRQLRESLADAPGKPSSPSPLRGDPNNPSPPRGEGTSEGSARPGAKP